MICPNCKINMDYDINTGEYYCSKCGLVIDSTDEFGYQENKTSNDIYIQFSDIVKEFINENHLNAFKENFDFYAKRFYMYFIKQDRPMEISVLYFLIFLDMIEVIPIDLNDKILNFAKEIFPKYFKSLFYNKNGDINDNK